MKKTRSMMKLCGSIIILMTVAGSTNFAQFGSRVVSPEILEDNQVVFRLYAPESDSVTLSGEWMQGFGMRIPLIKNDTGLWSVTVGPLAPEFYGYSFNVDGITVLDPSNGQIKRDGVRNASVLLVPGKESELYAVNDVPHGKLAKVWYPSPTLNLTRRMYVYTPPGYEDSDESYPVLYLLHGAGGDEDAWTTLGRTPQILDNLIAQGKAKPMLVVMTNGNATQAAAFTDAPVLENQVPVDRTQLAGKFEASLVNDVVPFIEERYRVLSDKDHRAVAGLSMGGGHTMNITNNNPDMFSYIGVMSMGARNPTEEFENQIETLKASGVKLYWIGCGVDDFLYESVTNLRNILDEHQFSYNYYQNQGGHTWANWRIYLSVLAPLLFQ